MSNWVNHGAISPGQSIQGLASHAGLTIAVDDAGNTFRSTDGGATWVAGTPTGVGGNGNLVYANGTWISGNGGIISRSIDNGVTWATIATGVATAGQGSIATDGAGKWLISGNIVDNARTDLYAVSTNDGVTWALPNITTNVGCACPPLWTGSEWVIVGADGISNDAQIRESADALTWGNTNSIHTGVGLFSLAQNGNIFLSTVGDGATLAGITHAATPAGLATSANINIPGLDVASGMNLVFYAAGTYFAFDASGGVATGPDPNTWTVGVLNMPGVGEAAQIICADGVHGTVIAGGSAGGIVTLIVPHWIYRTQLDVNGISAVAVHAGTSLAIDLDGNVHRSMDGGITWSLLSSVPGPAIGSTGNLIHDGTKWIWAASGDITYSSNDGIIWSAAATGLSGSNGVICYNGTGLYVVSSATSNFPVILNVARSTDGITWANAHSLHGPGSSYDSVIWDGTQFVIFGAVGGGVGTNTNYISTSPDGITWTETSSGLTTDIGFTCGAFKAGPLYAVVNFNGGMRHASTPLGLFSAPDTAIPGIAAGASLQLLDGSFVLSDYVGNSATSADAVTWTVLPLNYPAADFTPQIVEDSINGKWIAFGSSSGYLSTFDVGAPVFVPNVIGDTLVAAGATITGVGLTVGVLTYASSLTVPNGIVLNQTPVAGNSLSLGNPVALVMSTGAPIAAKLTKKLLLWLHHIFDKDPHQQLAFRLQYNGGLVWTIADGILTTVVTGGTGTNQAIDLAGYTVATLAAYLATLPGYSVPYQDTSSYQNFSTLILLDSTNNIATSNGDHIYGYTNFIWAYLEANGSELATAKAQIPNALEQMNTTTATDEWLDFQGGYYDVPRNQNELDPSYSPRIIASVLQPRGNNVAIASAIQAIALGAQRVRVIDAIDDTAFSITYNGLITFNGSEFYDGGLGPSGAYGFFDVDFSYDFSQSVTQATYLAQIESTVEAFRDGGTQLRAVIFRNNGSTTLIVSDSFIGGIRVIVYDDFSGNNYRLLESGLVRLLENGVDARLLE